MNNEEQTKNTELAPTNSEQTIMPTMIDNEDSGKSKTNRDLSAIIPKELDNGNPEGELLESKDKELKSDGSVVIGSILNEEEISVEANATFPLQIDIEARKAEKNKFVKNKRKKKDKISEEEKKSQNITSLIALVALCILGAFAYYYKNHKTENDFTTLAVTVELGDKLPIRTNQYVKPGIGNTVNEMKYHLNTSEVKIDEVGEYEFTVTFNGITKTGTINIVDTTAPQLTVKDLTFTEGTDYAAETFVDNCKDLSGCSFSFEDPNTTTKYNTAGVYEVYIVATDPYGNKEMIKAKLTSEEKGLVKKLTKIEPYDVTKGYSKEITYDLHFTSFQSDAILLRGYKTEVYKYQNDDLFTKDKEKYNGEENYVIDNNLKTITYSQPSVNMINNYSKMNDILSSLSQEGYIENT